MNKYIFILLTFVSFNSFASSFNSENEIRSYSDKLMQQVLKEDFDNAFNTMKPYWPIPAVEIDGIVNQIKLQWPIVNQRFGKPTGIEFIREERIGKSFLRYYYLHKFENHAIYWRLDFYKPVNTWKINGVNFLDTLDAIYK
jgi:hypothetical protein